MALIQDSDSKHNFEKADLACEMSGSGDTKLGIM